VKLENLGDMTLSEKISMFLSRIRQFFSRELFQIVVLQFGMAASGHADSVDDVLGDGLGEPFGNVIQRSWEEKAVPLPATPDDSKLIPLKIYKMPHYKYYIDSASVNVSAGDNVARYTVVIEPPSGLRNVFYEGIRCDTREYKIYASTLWGQALSPLSSSPWYEIQENATGAYRYDLFTYFLCEHSLIKGKKTQILQLLEYPPDNFIDEVLE
jgi:hypothetical protein